MKGDFTRDTFDPSRHYTRVLMQQGRVQLDADSNEQNAIDARRDETTTADLVGECGGPAENAAFEITAGSSGDFRLSSGRYYVNGIQCEAESEISYRNQPDRRDVPPLDAGTYLVFLDAWRRHLTMLDDEGIRESALGGPDTSTRVKTVWQVRAVPITDEDAAAPCARSSSEFDVLQRDNLPRLAAKTETPTTESDPCLVPATAGYRGLENQHYRVEIHNSGKPVGVCQSTDGKAVSLKGNQLKKAGAKFVVGQVVELFSVETSSDGEAVKERVLAWVTAVNGTTYSLNFAPSLTGPLRVRPVDATWKWSRENGSVAFGIQRFKPGSEDYVELTGSAPDENLGLHAGDWVELSNDALELEGQPGQIAQVIDPDAGGFVMLSAKLDERLLPDGVLGEHTKLRRWEGIGAVTCVTAGSQGWLGLESGVVIGFEPNGTAPVREFRTGDYWQIPARTASPDAESGKIDWPSSAGSPAFLELTGIRHEYCRLGIITVSAEAEAGAEDGLARPSRDEVRRGSLPISKVTPPKDGEPAAYAVTLEKDCRCLWPALSTVPRMFYVSGDGQEVMPYDPVNREARLFELPRPLIVRVAAPRCLGAARSTSKVRFVVTGGEGKVAQSTNSDPLSQIEVDTDSNGLAHCDFHLDARHPSQQVTAHLLDANRAPVSGPIIFNATLSTAGQVSYDASKCHGLTGRTTVQAALDHLCRQRDRVDCHATVGPAGDYDSVANALEHLKEREQVSLRLLPGQHVIAKQLVVARTKNFTIAGCGHSSILVVKAPLRFENLDGVVVRDISIQVTEASISFHQCQDVEISKCRIRGHVAESETALLHVGGASRFILFENDIGMHRGPVSSLPSVVLDEARNRSEVSALANVGLLSAPVGRVAKLLAGLSPGDRARLSREIETSTTGAGKPRKAAERSAYSGLVKLLAREKVTARPLVGALNSLRALEDSARAAGNALAISDYGTVSVVDNRIDGAVYLGGEPEAKPLTDREIAALAGLFDNVSFKTSIGSIQFRGNKVAQIGAGKESAGEVRQIIESSKGALSTWASAHFSDNVVGRNGNCLIARRLSLSSTHFLEKSPAKSLGHIVAETATCMGSIAAPETVVRSLTRTTVAEAANVGLVIMLAGR